MTLNVYYKWNKIYNSAHLAKQHAADLGVKCGLEPSSKAAEVRDTALPPTTAFKPSEVIYIAIPQERVPLKKLVGI